MAQDSGTIEYQDNTLLANLWPSFNVDGPYFDVEECAQAGDSMAVFTLEQYGIPYRPSQYDGGPLASMDIKRMDAMTVINQSLMEEFPAGGNLVEAMVDEEGYVEFVEIGSTGGGISDVYYTVQTHTYQDTAKGVMITGGRPLPTKRAIEYKPIWGEFNDSSKKIWVFQDMLSNCNLKNFTRYATVTFNDPGLEQVAWDDGRVTLFEPESPWDRFLGYVYYEKVPDALYNEDYDVILAKTSTVPIKIGDNPSIQAQNPSSATLVRSAADLGTIQLLPQYDPELGDCWSDTNQGVSIDYNLGVKVPIRDEGYNLSYTKLNGTIADKFIKISGVYVIGKKIEFLKSAPATDADAAVFATGGTEYESVRWVAIDDRQSRAFRLIEGRNYAVSYEDVNVEGRTLKTPWIIFAQEINPYDPIDYGTAVDFYLMPNCKFANENPDAIDGKYVGSILPIEQNRGLLVEELWVMVDLESPSLVINDPNGNAAEIAENLIYYVGALRMYEPPAPIGFAGEGYNSGVLVDQTVGFQDNDPTTAIDFEVESELERYYDIMQGGGMALTLSFLDENGVVDLAARLYNKLQFDGITSVHTCGPCAAPKLGRYGTSGVINSIQYSYSDKGAYTISVQEGPYIVGGLTPVDGGPSTKMSENFQASGTIIKDVGNNVHFKVLIDGYGERWAMSMVPGVLRVGDIVSVVVHNNPVEA